ncbi:hypothetical protein [Kitasatospora sp. NPDC047058]|uniref:hypothetical protein n=1 Tax=Kitasatospora sp. NPDC047058 TaxID=3155620 RepID=UPI0033E809C0
MAVEYTDNPAGRLRSLLLALHDRVQREGDKPAWECWAWLLAPDAPPSSPGPWTRFAAVLQLPGQIREAVASLDLDEEDKEHLIEHLDKIENALAASTTTGHSMTHVLSIFAPAADVPGSAAIQSLLTCSRALHRHCPEREASEEALQRISEAVTQLMEEILESAVDADIKRLLLAHLRSVLEAVQNARVTGQAPIEEATDAMLGAIARRPSVVARLQSLGLLSRIKTTIDTVNAVLAMEQEGNRLIHKVMEMLGG